MMILSLTAGLAACGLAGEGSQAAAKDAGVQRYAWPLGSSSPEDTVTQIYAEKFADEVERLSDGKMKISVYPNSVLGGDRELLESCKDGDIPFVVQNTAPQVTFMKDTAVRIFAQMLLSPQTFYQGDGRSILDNVCDSNSGHRYR